MNLKRDSDPRDEQICVCGHTAKHHILLKPCRQGYGYYPVKGKHRYDAGCNHMAGVPGMFCRCVKFQPKSG